MERWLRDLVWARAGSRCEYCRMPQEFDPLPFEVDHIIPQKHRGPTIEQNLALACFACNNHKGPNLAGIDPEANAIVPLFHPRQDIWTEHFSWEAAELRGLTPCGRATIVVLEINLSHRRVHRAALMVEGVFPN